MKVRAHQYDTVDALCWRHYGRTQGVTEQVLNQTKTEFFRDGMPRRIEFTLSLKRVDESLSDMFGDLSAQLNNLQDTATSALSDISKTVGGLLS